MTRVIGCKGRLAGRAGMVRPRRRSNNPLTPIPAICPPEGLPLMSPAEAAEKLTLRTDFSLLIDGQSVGAAAQLEVVNPATGAVFASCPAAGKAELDRAVAAARRAFSSWSELSFEDRTIAIKRMAEV